MRILSTLRLTNNQKQVISTIMSAPTPKVAGEQISGSQAMCTARDILVKIGVITYLHGEAKLTEKGEQLAQDEAIQPGGEQGIGGEIGQDDPALPGSEPELNPIDNDPNKNPLDANGLPTESYKLVKEVDGRVNPKPLTRKIAKKDIQTSEFKNFSTFFKSI